MSLSVLADENIPAVEHYLGEMASVRYFSGRHLDAAELSGVDALLVRSVTPVDRRLLADSGVRFVGTATSGFDHVDRRWLADADIAFAHAPGSNANAVVEYVLAATAVLDDFLERLLQGGRCGVVGFGHVGASLVRRLQALGIDYRVFDPWLDQAQVPRGADLDEVLSCDVVSLHCELTRDAPWPSEHLLGTAELRRMRGDSLLINASRGAVVHNTDLLRHLQQGAGPTVVLDVWEGEPDINRDLLQQVALGTAHIAGYSSDGKVLATRMICSALAACLGLPEPTVDSPLEAPAELHLAGEGGAALLRRLLCGRYDILRDDALLRGALLAAGRVEARERFDDLRRDYAGRRELAATTVRGDVADEADIERVRALGCRYRRPGEPA